MKKTSFFPLLCLIAAATNAQPCAEMFDYFKPGVTLEYTNYNKKGKVKSVNSQKVTQIDYSGDTLVATFAMTATDEKGKEFLHSSFPMKCHAGTVFMDMGSMMPPQQHAPDMQVAITSTDQVFPANMRVGQSLPDAEMDMKMSMGGLQLMNTHYTMKNRKVVAEETITTSAGAFKCLKITLDSEYRFMGTRTAHIESWFSPTVGTVRTVGYDEKGAEESRMELTKVTK